METKHNDAAQNDSAATINTNTTALQISPRMLVSHP
jgi:hypothetical protein